MLVLYTPVLITHICDLLRRPDLRAHYWSCNGVVWKHTLFWPKRGDVITVRPHRTALFTAPLLLRVNYRVQSLLFDLTWASTFRSCQTLGNCVCSSRTLLRRL